MDLLTEEEVHYVLAGKTTEHIESMEHFMLDQPQVEIPVQERFINGMYAREIVIPKGTLMTGRVYKEGYLDIMLSGDIAVATPQGTRRMTGANIMEAPPGRKRAGYAFEDTRWITVHRTDHYQEGDMVDRLTFFSMEQYRDYVRQRDHASYLAVLEMAGMTEDQVQAQVQNESDRVELKQPYSEFVTVALSYLHGNGLKACRDFEIGEVVGPARTAEGGRTIIGRYSNHSANPNAIMELAEDNSVWAVATRKINMGDEITTHYGLTLQSIQGALCQE